MKLWSPDRPNFWDINYEHASERYNDAVYIAETSIKQPTGGYTQYPVAVFFQDDPEDESYPDHFGLFKQGFSHKVFICGVPDFNPIVHALHKPETGEIIWSRYGHDYTTSSDGHASIDGGRDYCRYGFSPGHAMHWNRVAYNIETNLIEPARTDV